MRLREAYTPLGALIAAGATAMTYLVAWPFWNVTTGDDGIYVRAVERLLTEGRLALGSTTTPSVVGLVLWAAAICKLVGFSINATLGTTAPLAFLGAWSLHALGRLQGAGERACALVTMGFAAGPFAGRLNPTFMTDAPFVAATFVALLLLTRHAATGRIAWLAAFGVLCGASYSVRQVALCVLLGGIVGSVASCTGAAGRVRAAAAVMAGFLVAAAPYEYWLRALGGQTWIQHTVEGPGTFAYLAAPGSSVRIVADALALGVFASLVASPLIAGGLRWGGARLLAGAGVVGASVLAALAAGRPWYHPFWPGGAFDILAIGRIGPLYLALAVPAAVVGCAAVAALVLEGPWDARMLGLAAAAGSLVGIAALRRGDIYDRYAFPVVALLVVAALPRIPASGLVAAGCAASVALGLLAAAGTGFNYRVAALQWRIADDVVACGVDRAAVRGNMSWELYHLDVPSTEHSSIADAQRPPRVLVKLVEVLGRARRSDLGGFQELASWEVGLPGVTLGRVAALADGEGEALLPCLRRLSHLPGGAAR